MQHLLYSFIYDMSLHNAAQSVQCESFQDAIRSMHQGLHDEGDKQGTYGPDYHPVAAQCKWPTLIQNSLYRLRIDFGRSKSKKCLYIVGM